MVSAGEVNSQDHMGTDPGLVYPTVEAFLVYHSASLHEALFQCDSRLRPLSLVGTVAELEEYDVGG